MLFLHQSSNRCQIKFDKKASLFVACARLVVNLVDMLATVGEAYVSLSGGTTTCRNEDFYQANHSYGVWLVDLKVRYPHGQHIFLQPRNTMKPPSSFERLKEISRQLVVMPQEN